MALANVLSAMREMILNDLDIPSDPTIRLESLKNRFSLLSTAELEDLADISPQQLKIYTKTIYAGEASSIGQHFPITVALLSSVWQNIYGRPFNAFEFAKLLHQKREWKGYLTEQLCRNVVTYLKEDAPEIQKEIPVIGDVSTFEFVALCLTRAPNEQWMAQDSIGIDEINTLTVDEMMERDFIIPENIALLHCQFDVISLSRFFYSHGRSLPEDSFQGGKFWIAGGRDKKLNARFTYIDQPIFSYLQRFPRGKKLLISDFAEQFLESRSDENIPQAEDGLGDRERELFLHFSTLVIELLDVGVVVLPE